MTVARLLQETDVGEITEWIAYYRLQRRREQEEDLADGAWGVVQSIRERKG